MKALFQVFTLNVVGKLLLAVMTVLVIRFMPPGQYARYTVALALATCVSQSLSSTFNSIYIVGHQRLALEARFGALLTLQVLILSAVWLLLIPFQSPMSATFWWALAFSISICAVEFTKTAYQQQHRFLSFSLVEIAKSAAILASTAALIYAVREQVRAWHVLAIQAGSMLAVSALAVHARASGQEFTRLSRARDIGLRVLRGEYPFLFGYFAIVALLGQTAIFALKWLASDVELASFGAAFRYYSLLSLGLTAAHVVLLPSLQDSRSPDAVDAVFSQQARALVVFAAAVLVGMMIAPWVLPWLDGGKYPASVPAFQVLSLSAIVSFALSPHANLVLRHEQFRFLFKLVLAAFALHVALAYPLVEKWGAVGAAWSAAAAFALLNGLSYARAMALRKNPGTTGAQAVQARPLAGR